MFAKISLVLTLLVSLLFVTQAQPVAPPVEMAAGGGCSGMECVRGCCTNMACCIVTEQQKEPQTPAASPQQQALVQLAPIGLRTYVLLFPPPARVRPFVILDEASTAHTLSPRAVNCIQLI